MKKPLVLLFILVPILVVAGCRNPVVRGGDGAGRLSLTIVSAAGAKTFMPASEAVRVAQYIIRGTGPSGESLNPVVVDGETAVLNELAAGEWKIEVDGRNSAYVPVVAGSRTVEVVRDSTAEAEIFLSPVSGRGSVSLNLSWPASVPVGTVAGTFADPDGETAASFDEDLTDGDSQGTDFWKTVDLPSGSYVLSLELRDGAGVVLCTLVHAVRVYSDLLTRGRIELTEADFNSAPSAPEQFEALYDGSDIVLSWIDTAKTESGYRIERRTENGGFGLLAELAADVQEYVDDSVSPDTLYTYRLTAFNGFGSSAQLEASARTEPPRLPGELASFGFTVDDNPALLLSDVDGSVDAATGAVMVNVPQGTVLNGLTAEFTATPGADVRVNGVRQTSGVTGNNFSAPLVYTVTGTDGSVRNYTVTVNRTQDIVFSERSGSFSYRLDFGSGTRDVYFVMTNPSTTVSTTAPTVSLSNVSRGLTSRSLSPAPLPPPTDIPPEWTSGSSDIAEFNALAPADARMLSSGSSSPVSRALSAPVSRAALPGESRAFYAYDRDAAGSTVIVPVSATCRGVVTGVSTGNGPRSLFVWVADDTWIAGGTKSHLVTQTMVDAFTDRFLRTGADNDIYDWVSNIFGAEWGPHPQTYLIQPDGELHVLLYDIFGDDDISRTGGTVGLFSAKDNYLQSSNGDSNEQLMFYLDSVLFATADGTNWEVSDYWPEAAISTLAHEFQHMIHYYQKNVTYNSYSDTWLNEMCSLVAEDFVADKLGITGPRGVPLSGSYDYTSGVPWIVRGRLPRFDYYNDDSIVVWQNAPVDVYRSYSIAYAFGAYLARNYGGAAFFRSVVQSPGYSVNALVDAAAGQGYSVSFSDMLRNWGVAVLLSDRTDAPRFMRYNRDTSFDSSSGATTYRLGSIDLFKYSFLPDGSGSYSFGPQFYDEGAVGGGNSASNAFYRAGSIRSGSWNITLPEGTLMTLVVKE